MANEQAVNVLNRLLRAEYESLVPRLREADPFVSMESADDRRVIAGILRDVESHERDLSEMILRLRGAPASPRYSTDSGAIHYVTLAHLMPQILANLRQLIALYESSAGTTGDREADGLVSRILDNYRRGHAGLEKLHANLAAAK